MLLQLDPQTWQLESERLIIRAPRPGEGAKVSEAVSDSLQELSLWMPWAKARPTPEESEAFGLKAYETFASGEEYPMRLWLKDGTFVGGTGLHRGNRDVPSFEIGYWCRSSLTGRGYITEAVNTLRAFAFGDFGLQRLEIRCDARNHASRRVAERCGFRLEGILGRHERATDGSLRDTCIFARFPDTV